MPDKIVLRPVRIRRGYNTKPQAAPKITVPSRKTVYDASLPVEKLVVEMPAELAATVKEIAAYEERSRQTVLRSLIKLGLRVYAHLSNDISPYGPAADDVTVEEIAEVAEKISHTYASA